MSSARKLFLLGFLACTAAMGVALYFQHVMGLEPCPLCIFQRISVIILGILFLIGLLHGPGATGSRFYGFLATLSALGGIGIAMRHLWLQYGAHEALGCGPGLNFMLDTMPLQDVIRDVLKGTGDCGEIVWSMFGISIPGWTLMFLLVMLGISLRLLFKPE